MEATFLPVRSRSGSLVINNYKSQLNQLYSVLTGTQLRGVPRLLLGFSRLLVVWWGAEAAVEASTGTSGALPAAAALAAANSTLKRGPVMIQAIGVRNAAAIRHVMFPPDGDTCAGVFYLVLYY